MNRFFAMALASIFVAGTAQAQHVDILVARDTTGTKLVSGSADISNGNYVVGARVFGAEFGEDPLLPHLASDPGYNAVTNPTGGLALPGNTSLNFNFKNITIGSAQSNLFYWDGTGSVNFSPVSAGQTLTASKSGGFSATVDGSPLDVTGFTINPTSSTGFVHKHLDFELTGNGGNPADGIYLVSQQFQMTSLQASDPIFLVFNSGMTELIHDDATQWVQTNLTPVPEPSWLLLISALGLTVRRKAS